MIILINERLLCTAEHFKYILLCVGFSYRP